MPPCKLGNYNSRGNLDGYTRIIEIKYSHSLILCDNHSTSLIVLGRRHHHQTEILQRPEFASISRGKDGCGNRVYELELEDLPKNKHQTIE